MTGYDSKREAAADKLQEDVLNYGTAWSQDGKRIDPMSVYKEPVTEREALKLALEVMQINLTLLEKVDPYEDQEDLLSDSLDVTHKAIASIKEALAQPWPDLNKRDRESYQKGHNDGVAHHKQSVKAAQPAQEVDYWIREATAARQAEMALRRELEEQPAQEPVVQPAPGYCKNCKDYTIEEPLPAQPAQEPVAWKTMEAKYPSLEKLDIRMRDGSILCDVWPQSDGDFWWAGSGTGEKFIDPKYADVTHWRVHSDTTAPQREWVGLTDEDKSELAKAQHSWEDLCLAVESKLKERNHGT